VEHVAGTGVQLSHYAWTLLEGELTILKKVSLTGIAAVVMAMGLAPDTASAWHRHHHYRHYRYYRACHRHGTTGAVVGGVGGGLIGNAVTHGSFVGTVVGAGAGALVGHHIGKHTC
jgi:hypothetical protein